MVGMPSFFHCKHNLLYNRNAAKKEDRYFVAQKHFFFTPFWRCLFSWESARYDNDWCWIFAKPCSTSPVFQNRSFQVNQMVNFCRACGFPDCPKYYFLGKLSKSFKYRCRTCFFDRIHSVKACKHSACVNCGCKPCNSFLYTKLPAGKCLNQSLCINKLNCRTGPA